jgi:23S rRNA (cytosine1962-C5)-methyltransferase
MAEASIRWIAEDAMKFVRRELKRGNRYDAVILDPPSYGHGPRGEVWRLSKHLKRLLSMCGELTDGRRRFMLLTCHTPGFGPQRLCAMMAEGLGLASETDVEADRLCLRTAAGRELSSGVVVRWAPDPGHR